MTQAQTLQDIYLKIADIKDSLCNVDEVTSIKENIVISKIDYSATLLELSNPNTKQSITDAQVSINKLITSALAIAKDNRLKSDATYLASTGAIEPVPDNSPIALLPILLKALVLYELPLKFLTQAITDYLGDILLEHIKRKLSEKDAKLVDIQNIVKSRLINIPNDANSLVISFSNLPSWLGKRFVPLDINIDAINPYPAIPPNFSKYLLLGLGTINFGYSIAGILSASSIFWEEDRTLRYTENICKIEKESFSNYRRYAYLHCEFENTAKIGFIK